MPICFRKKTTSLTAHKTQKTVTNEIKKMYKDLEKDVIDGPFELLGSGTFSDVVQPVQNDAGIAIKTIKFTKATQLRTAMSELKVRREMKVDGCPHLLFLMGFFINRQVIGLIYPKMNISLDKLVNLRECQVEVAICYMSILMALSFLNSKRIIHADVKKENILCHQGKFVLGDLGSCILGCRISFSGRDLLEAPDLRKPFHSLPTAAPETLVDQNRKFDNSCDVFGAGCVLYWMIQGRNPFTLAQVMQKMMRGEKMKLKFEKKTFSKYDPSLMIILKFCLDQDIRPTPDSLLTNQILIEACDTYGIGVDCSTYSIFKRSKDLKPML